MVTGWRRAFYTSISKEREPSSSTTEKQCTPNNPHSPRITSKFGFFSSNPSTPRLPSRHLQHPPSLPCKTTTPTPTSSLPNSPRLQCKTPHPLKKPSHNPRFFHFFNTNDTPNTTPSSPKSPASSAFSLLKSTLRLSKQQSSGRCGICIQEVKSGEGTTIFTAECNIVGLYELGWHLSFGRAAAGEEGDRGKVVKVAGRGREQLISAEHVVDTDTVAGQKICTTFFSAQARSSELSKTDPTVS